MRLEMRLCRESLSAQQAVHPCSHFFRDLHRLPWMTWRSQDDHVVRLVERYWRFRLIEMPALERHALSTSECLLYFIRRLTECRPGNGLLHESQLILRPPL